MELLSMVRRWAEEKREFLTTMMKLLCHWPRIKHSFFVTADKVAQIHQSYHRYTRHLSIRHLLTEMFSGV